MTPNGPKELVVTKLDVWELVVCLSNWAFKEVRFFAKLHVLCNIKAVSFT